MRKVMAIFGELSDTDVDWLAQAGEKANVRAGTVMIPIGTRVDQLCIILDGELLIKAPNGGVIAKLESGEIVGELSLVDPAPATVSVEAAADTLLFRVPHAKLRQKLMEDTAFAARFYRALCIFLADRLRITTRRITSNEPEHDEPENVVATMHKASARFARMLQKMLAS